MFIKNFNELIEYYKSNDDSLLPFTSYDGISYKDYRKARVCWQIANNTTIIGRGYTVEVVEDYVDNSTKIPITCSKHGTFWMTTGNLLAGKSCSKCADQSRARKHSKTNERYIESLQELYGDEFDYSLVKYTGAFDKVTLICRHGHKFQRIAKKLYEAKPRCDGCILLKREENPTKYRKRSIPRTPDEILAERRESFIRKANEKYDNKFDYSLVDYVNNSTEVKIICPVHGVFKQIPSSHLSTNKHGCVECGNLIQPFRKKTTNQFIREAREIHGDRYDYSDSVYNGVFKKISIICKKHGAFKQTPKNHLAGNGCSQCNCKKRISIISQEWLNSLGLADMAIEYNVPGLRNLVVDGFDPSTNTVFQFHGDYWHGNPRVYNSGEVHPHRKVTYGVVYNNSCKIDQEIVDAGYNLVVMWEKDYRSKGDDAPFTYYCGR